MAAGPRDATDFGIKRLLSNDSEDESFWAYFSEFDTAKQPPLTFPIPPTLETAVATATPTTQPMSMPTESTTTNTVDNHYQLNILSDIQNTIDKKPLNNEDIEKFDQQKNKHQTKDWEWLEEMVSVEWGAWRDEGV